MVRLPARDPADLVAQARREAGLSRQLQVVRDARPDPSRGGSGGYEGWFRDDELEREANGQPCRSSRSSRWRWKSRPERYRQTGNTDRTHLVGMDMLNLVVFLLSYPDATTDEMVVNIYNGGGELYDGRLVAAHLKDLQITKKKASTEAYQALTPENLMRAHLFWNRPPPLGVMGVPRRKLTDIDEFALTLEKCNRTQGWALKCHRVRKERHYKFGLKITVLLAIEPGDPRLPLNAVGSVENPRRWVRCIQNGGTTAIVFRDFVDMVCSSIENNPILGVTDTDAHRIFMWDNLRSHHSACVTQTVTGRGGPCRFSIVPRPPYQPKYGPIEYKICDLTHEVRMKKKQAWDIPRLEAEIYRAARRIVPFNSTFDHCGYKWL